MRTRRQCAGVCIRHYGIWEVLTDNMGDAHNDERGNLNPCLACDESASGPAFQYAAGRTRRTSGLVSAIERSTMEIFDVDHHLYFEQETATLGARTGSADTLRTRDPMFTLCAMRAAERHDDPACPTIPFEFDADQGGGERWTTPTAFPGTVSTRSIPSDHLPFVRGLLMERVELSDPVQQLQGCSPASTTRTSTNLMANKLILRPNVWVDPDVAG